METLDCSADTLFIVSLAIKYILQKGEQNSHPWPVQSRAFVTCHLCWHLHRTFNAFEGHFSYSQRFFIYNDYKLETNKLLTVLLVSSLLVSNLKLLYSYSCSMWFPQTPQCHVYQYHKPPCSPRSLCKTATLSWCIFDLEKA